MKKIIALSVMCLALGIFTSAMAFAEDEAKGRIGISLRNNSSGSPVVAAVLPKSGARDVAIAPGDVIISIDGVDTFNMPATDAVKLLRGPVNSDCKVRIQRNGTTKSFIIRRSEIKDDTNS